MTTTQSWTEEFVEVAGAKTRFLKGGTGAPLLVIRVGGSPAWLPDHEALSQRFTVLAPSPPGYDKSERPPWVSTMTDMAHFYLGLMQGLGLQQASLIGFSTGGWLAAELAAMSPDRVKGMVLVDSVGIKPKMGEIAEVLMVSPAQTLGLSYYDESKVPSPSEPSPEEQNVLWRNREMTSRLCWKPYMHNPSLPEYLKLIRIPSLIVWGRQDRIVPLECGELYHRALQGSTLHVVDQCGHSPQIEQPEEFLKVVTGFLAKL